MLELILIAVVATWCLIAGLFLAICRMAARGDSALVESEEPGGRGAAAPQDLRAAAPQSLRAIDGEPRISGAPPETHPLELLLQDRRAAPVTLKGRVAR